MHARVINRYFYRTRILRGGDFNAAFLKASCPAVHIFSFGNALINLCHKKREREKKREKH